MKRIAPAIAIALALLAACGGDGDTASSTTSTTSKTSTTAKGATTTTSAPSAGSDVPLADVRIKLTHVAELDQPLDLAWRKGDPNLYVAEKGGRIQRVAPDGTATKVLDISSKVSTGNEQGLLGIVFSPDGTKLYIHYTNTDGDTRLEELAWDARTDDGARTILTVDQPYANHNGGKLAFGPDGLLYIGLGDGGAGGDPHHNGQDPDALLGKILAIRPEQPADPVRYVIGVRNPWRFSFDRANGDLWVGDVGQDAWEEIDHIAAGTAPGVNLGWNRFEGDHKYEGANDRRGLLFPVYEYGHDVGQSVVGGYVYRGSKVPALRGVYLFTDTYRGNIQALRLRGTDVEHADLGVTAPDGYVASFGEDAAGELYVLSLNGGVYRIDGA